MPLLSAFTPYGALRFSSSMATGQKMYNALARMEGGAFSLDEGTDTGAETYATAMLLANAADTQERAKNQRDPLQATEMLPSLEANYLASPLTTQTLDQRRQAQAARMVRPAGGRRTDIEAALLAAIGSAFVAYRPTPISEAVTCPANPFTQGLFTRTDIAPKRYKLTSPVAFTGSYAPVSFVPILGSPPLVENDRLVVGCENRTQRETVIATNVTASTFVAPCGYSHDVGAICSTGPFPAWSSTKRHSLIIVTAAAAMSPAIRQTIAQVMKKYARGVSTWSVVRVSAPGARTTNAFTIGGGRIGLDTVGAVAF